jgi:hypothetical protein
MKTVETAGSAFCFCFETVNPAVFQFLFFRDSRVFLYSIACRRFVKSVAASGFVSALVAAPHVSSDTYSDITHMIGLKTLPDWAGAGRGQYRRGSGDAFLDLAKCIFRDSQAYMWQIFPSRAACTVPALLADITNEALATNRPGTHQTDALLVNKRHRKSLQKSPTNSEINPPKWKSQSG